MANSSRSWTASVVHPGWPEKWVDPGWPTQVDLGLETWIFSSNFFLRIFVFRNLFFGNLFFGNFASEIFASEIFASEIFASLPPIPFPFPPLLLSSSTLLLLQVPLCSDLACSSSSYLSVATWPPETPRPVADTWSVRIIAQWKTLQKRPKALADPDHRRKSSYQDLTQASTSSIFAISTDCRMADKGMLLFRCIPSRGSFSAVSTPMFASKYSLESSRRDLHDGLLCTVPTGQIFV